MMGLAGRIVQVSTAGPNIDEGAVGAHWAVALEARKAELDPRCRSPWYIPHLGG